ncbi:glycosyltransferase family 2 protein [Deferribacter autotrophicus]|uniref:Glycosyltransferase family 2 protein n=1 Tax=Deferribacter autotrophicus TaxID=500465 RepID=A0A5A8F621_9BACT|nr:glycosyltransferase family 2 protein [Deferribacter autotrophicus]KAA0258995.1 glycosyltransferase family 2 protein [Deferribacter autotrophicus]
MEKISVVILTFNGEKYLEACLSQISKIGDEIIIVDSGSSDNTISIAKKFTDKIFFHEFENYGRQCRYAVSLTACKWVFVVDQDEILTDALVDEIKYLKLTGFDCDGYYIKRDNYLFGKLIKHGGWGDDYVLRLFNKEKGEHTDNNFSVVKTEGMTKKLKHSIKHYPYDSVHEYLSKMHSYANHSAKEMLSQNKTFKLRKLILNPFGRFFKKYILEFGFLDGLHGFVLAVFSYYFVFLKYLRFWELKRNEK